jgi:Protein of unknown function (DUF1501)
MNTCRSKQTGTFNRRDFLHVGSAGLLGLSLGNMPGHRALASPEGAGPRARNVIMLFLSGGPATIDLWDMKPEARVNVRGEFQPRETSVPGLSICEHLPKLASQMHRVSLVRSVNHPIPEHGLGVAYVMSGNRPNPAFAYPSLGSLSAGLLKVNRGIPPYMAAGGAYGQAHLGGGELGTALNPFEFSMEGRPGDDRRAGGIGLPSGFTLTDLDRREKVLQRVDRRMRSLDDSPLPKQLGLFQKEALDILRSDRINQALDVDRESDARRQKYGVGMLGRSALAAGRLIAAGARFVTIEFGGWDTHANNFTQLRTTLLPQLDPALAALIEDLDMQGLLDETIVYCTGEFGRTPEVNSSAGRDHWSRSMTALVAGGGFRRGFVYGATDKEGNDPSDNPCSPDDLSATIFHQLGFPPTHIVQTQAGRPVPIFKNGRVVEGLLG